MSDQSKPGIKAALARDVDSAGASARAAVTPAGQVDLFEAANDARMPLPEPAGASGPKGGRPKGAQNVRTRVVADYYLNRYGDPLEAMLRLGMRPVGDLVRELQAVAAETGVRLVGKNQSLKDLLGVQMHALEAALPYLRQRMPLAVDVETVRRDVLIIGDVSARQRDRMGALGIDLDAVRAPVEQNQGVSVIEGDAFPVVSFPDDGQGVDPKGFSEDQAGD